MRVFVVHVTPQSPSYSIARHAVQWVVGIAVVVLTCVGSARAASPRDVDEAISHAKEYLYSIQSNGNWEPVDERLDPPKNMRSRAGYDWVKSPPGGQWTGQTAIVVYALLAAGENPHDERLEPAIDFLRKNPTQGVYASAMRAQVWLLLPRTNETRALMRKEVAVLDRCFYTDGPFKGLYDYGPTPMSYSLSRSQYGVLGMWAAAQMGEPVRANYWRLVESAWTGLQKPNGAWQYIEDADFDPTPGITAVGVATLFITQDYLHADRGVNCTGNIDSPAIDRGMEWMIDHFDMVATDQRYDRDLPLPTLYAIERIGTASGFKRFGNIDWYQKGADWLIRTQRENGSWIADEIDLIPTVADTSFGILFLARGRSPLVMSKLQYTEPDGKPGQWNQRPRDVANITRFVGEAAERDLNWQIVDIDGDVSDLFDAPIVYVSGKSAWKPNAKQIEKLRQFLEDGGLLLANADCGGASFAASVKELGQTMFPAYAFRELPEDHPIYTEEQFPRSRWKTRHSVLGLSNGAREMMLLVPSGDVARVWQLNNPRGREDVWQLGSDIFQYAVDKRNLRLRGEDYRVARDELAKPAKSLTVARVQYNGNWNPEPAGWRRLSNQLWNNETLNLTVSPATLGAGALTPGVASLAHLTGTDEVTFDEAQVAELKAFIDAGGTLVIDSAGGSSAFATSAEQLISTLFPSEHLKRLSESSSLYTQNLLRASAATAPASSRSSTQPTAATRPFLEVRFRPFAAARIGVGSTPRVQAIEKNGRVVLYYSREDLSAGLVGQPVDGIIGYEPASATEIMSRILVVITQGR